jgi:hypothetical protein
VGPAFFVPGGYASGMKNDENIKPAPYKAPLSFTDTIKALEAELQSVKKKSANELQGVRRQLEDALETSSRYQRSETNMRERARIYEKALTICERQSGIIERLSKGGA